MITEKLTEALERIEAWPPEVQDMFANFALELEAAFGSDEVEPTQEELAGIDRGLRAAAQGRFATDQQLEAVFAKFRDALEARQFDAASERDVREGKLDALAMEALAEHRGRDRMLRGIAEAGKRRYASLREDLERDHFGAHVMINTDTSDYIVAPTLLQAHTAFVERFGEEAPCWTTRIGVSIFATI